jgi:hypothetical protein
MHGAHAVCCTKTTGLVPLHAMILHAVFFLLGPVISSSGAEALEVGMAF